MAFDFRASQLRSEALIGSGSSGLFLIYPSSSATDLEGGNSLDLSAVGADTWLFFHGDANAKDGSTRGVAVFGGDTVFSSSHYIFGRVNHGVGNVASGDSAYAQGETCYAFGDYSHAEGQSCGAYGVFSHAEGYQCTAFNAYSHAEGYQCAAYGGNSHAEGENTITYGNYAHAEGQSTIAVGANSHAGGIGTIASGSGQTVVGAYNLRDNDFSLFIVGDGADDDNPSRRDVFRVNPQAVEVTGSLHVSNGITGSIERLPNGDAYIVGASGISVVTNSGGQVEVGLATTSPFTEFSGIAAPASDTPEAIFTLPLDPNDVIILEAQIIAMESTPTTNRAYFNRRIFAFGGAMSATLDQESTTTPDFKTDAAWGVNFAVSGSSVVLWVTGAAASPTDWVVSGRYSNIQ